MEFIPDEQLDKLSLDELRGERSRIQSVRKITKTYLHKITLIINGIYQENEALKKLTPETARALGMPEDKIELIKALHAKRKAGNDIVIQHRHTLTITPTGVKCKEEVK